MFKTSNGRHRIKMSAGWTLLVRWYAVCPVLMRFVRFSCVWHPVGILYVSVDVISNGVVNGQLQDIYWSSPDECRVCILWSFNERCVHFLYGTYSFCPLCIHYTYVNWPFFGSYLSGTYALITTSAIPKKHPYSGTQWGFILALWSARYQPSHAKCDDFCWNVNC